MQSNLHCSSTNCAFNKSGSCYASNIKVEGFDAKITPETYCNTFMEGSSNSLASYNNDAVITTTLNITCSANECKYNLSGGCAASFVDINFENNSCDTFIKR